MRTILAVIVLAAVAGGLTAQDKKFDSKEGKFTATFPSQDTPKSVSHKAGGFDLNITILEKGKGGFAVIYSDMPEDKVKATPAAKLLESGEKGLVDNFKAKVTKSTESKFKSGDKEYASREITAEKEDTHMRITIILVGNRLYQVFVIGPKDVVSGPEADAFIKSFALLEFKL